jgi:hypothetical protein
MDDLCALCIQFEESGEAPQKRKWVISTSDLKQADIELIKLTAKCSDLQFTCHYHIRIPLSAFEGRNNHES